MADAPPKAPYGDVEYADPGYQKDGKKRYPIDTKEHCQAAWSYINKASNQSPYSSDQVAKIKDKIQAAAKKFGIKIDDGDGDEGDKPMAKPAAKKPAMAGTKSAPIDGTETSVTDAARKGTSAAGEQPDDAALKGTSTGHAINTIRKVEPKVKTLEELRVRLAEVEARMIEIGEETRDAELDTETQTEWDGLQVEVERTRSSIRRIEERADALKAMAVSEPGKVERTTPNFIKKPENIYDVAAIRMASDSPEDFSQRLRDNAMRAVEAATYQIPKGIRATKEDAQTYAAELLDTIETEDGVLAKRMLLTGSKAYESGFAKVVRYGNDVMCTTEERQALVRAQALGTDSAGGFAVPFQLDPTVILNNAGTVNPIRQLARVEQITGKEYDFVTSAGVTANRGTEGSAVADGSFTLAQPTVRTNRVAAFVPFNVEIELTWGSLRSEITKLLVDAKAREEDSFITGDGSTGQQPGGVVGSLSGNTVTAGGVASFSANDVYATHAALDPRWENNSSWLAHKGIYNKIRQFDSAGGAQLWAQIGEGRPNQLLSYTAAYASAMDSTLTTGKKILLYGDFSQFLIVDRIGMTFELVPHLFDQATARPTGQRGIYAVWMNNSKILVNSAFKLLVTG
jgi:HK97 family phage major capsid protein